MEDNKELVEETENVELTTEEIEDVETPEEEPIEEKEVTTEPVETFTREQVNEMVNKRLIRQENKIRKEYAKKYGRLETVVNTGLGTENVDEAVDKLTEFYQSKGISIPKEPQYSPRDLEVLANAEAEDIITDGYESIVEEVNRMAQMDASEMSERDKLVFTKLANKRKEMEEVKELASIGVKLEDLDDPKVWEAVRRSMTHQN